MAGRVSFHSMQADWQALQPMHFETSMSFATSTSAVRLELRASRRVAETRMTSRGWNVVIVILPYATGWVDRLDVHQERLVFRRLDIRVADGGRQRVRAEALFGCAHEAPVQAGCRRRGPSCRRRSGLIRFVTTALALIEPRFDQTRTQPPFSMPFSFASSSEISTKNSGCSTALIGLVLRPEVEVLGQPVGGRRIGELLGRAEALPCRP